MKKYEKFFKNNLYEEIYGNNAIVYHRTRLSDLINRIYTTGFKSGEGDMYGKGFYGTYDLKSQLMKGKTLKDGTFVPSMEDRYGNIIVKFQISLENFFFFDFSEFLKSPLYKNFIKQRNKIVPTNKNFIQLQLNYYEVDLEYNYRKVSYSSEIAQRMWKYLKNKVSGIIFTGKRDGKVLVCYDIDRLIPISFSVDNAKTFEKVTPKNLEYIKNVFKLKNFIKKDIKLPDWVIKSGNVPSSFTFIDDIFTWENGTWKDGFWEGGTWEDGFWEKGYWYNGTWKNGLWKNGIWKDGIWYSGTWKDGIWYSGTWEKGTWEYGLWKNGTWEYGLWKNGTWKNGLWNSGIWEKGIWEGGTWRYGTWKDGIWKDGIWEKGWIFDPKKKGNFEKNWEWNNKFVLSKINPKEYFKKK